MRTFINSYGPLSVYAPDGHIFLIFLHIFFYDYYHTDITTSPHHQHNMTEHYHHHNIMYDSHPLFSPVFLLYLLSFVRTFPLSLHV